MLTACDWTSMPRVEGGLLLPPPGAGGGPMIDAMVEAMRRAAPGVVTEPDRVDTAAMASILL